MAVRKLVFLSDVHIGTNTPVNWYQQSVHEPFLQAALRYIYKEAAQIDELIVLGDLFDLWTCLPDQAPPSFHDVLKANQAVFGDGGGLGRGMLEQVLTALEGRVSFLNGNHDMTVTQDDLNAIRGAQGETMTLVDAPTYKPKGGLGKVACTHGHMFSVFCAADSKSSLAPLPIGYFVTRLAAQWDHEQLKRFPPGSTVADMKNAGTPTGWGFTEENIERILYAMADHSSDMAEIVFDVIIGDGKEKQQEQTFRMPDGTRPNAYDLATQIYKSTYDEWVNRAEGLPDLFGDKPGPFALGEVDFEDSLLHFAKVLGESNKVVVMGHTHALKDETDYPWYIRSLGESLYVNCGFNCPSKPDMQRERNPKHPTFVELLIDESAGSCTALVRYVESKGAAYAVAPAPLQTAEIQL